MFQENITEEDVLEVMDLFFKVPVILLKIAISNNMNAVRKFEDQIVSYKDKLSLKDIEKIELVTEMPVDKIQEILLNVYIKTGKKQFKLLSDPKAQKFISINLKELKKVLFN